MSEKGIAPEGNSSKTIWTASYIVDGCGPYQYSMGIGQEPYLPRFVHKCAEEFHGRHNGWEFNWPVTIQVSTFYYGKLRECGTFEVDRVLLPTFETVREVNYAD